MGKNEKITRREFLKRTGAGAAATVTGLAAVDKLLSPDQAQAAPVANGASNAKNAGSVISLPKGGGAIKGIGETFKPNPFTGTANFSVPIATSPGRAGFGPELSLQYSSGNGNGPFGLGWSLSVPMVSRKTEKGIPNIEMMMFSCCQGRRTWFRGLKMKHPGDQAPRVTIELRPIVRVLRDYLPKSNVGNEFPDLRSLCSMIFSGK